MNNAIASNCSRISKRVGMSVAVAAASLAASIGGGAAAHAAPPCMVNGHQVNVQGHHDVWVDARWQSTQVATVRPGHAINVTYLSGTVWSGTWFTSPNGPAGWVHWPAPMSPYGTAVNGSVVDTPSEWAAPGVDLYSMVGQLAPIDRRGLAWNQPAFHATAGQDPCVHSADSATYTYSVTMNDRRFDDNTGGFWVRVEELG